MPCPSGNWRRRQIGRIGSLTHRYHSGMSAPAPVPNSRILIAEDESGIADTLQYVLRSDGFTPVWCATAQEAIAQFAQEPPALAILDVGLPDLNGFELFKRLHALPGGADVPMIFLTARSDEIDRVVGLILGADDYIANPFSPRGTRRTGQDGAQTQRAARRGHCP